MNIKMRNIVAKVLILVLAVAVLIPVTIKTQRVEAVTVSTFSDLKTALEKNTTSTQYVKITQNIAVSERINVGSGTKIVYCASAKTLSKKSGFTSYIFNVTKATTLKIGIKDVGSENANGKLTITGHTTLGQGKNNALINVENAGATVHVGANCTLKNNEAGNTVGGAMRVINCDDVSIYGTITNCSCTYDKEINVKESNAIKNGGAIYFGKGTLTLKDGSVISNCSTKGHGGAVAAYGGTFKMNAGAKITGCTITKITSSTATAYRDAQTYNGGAIYIQGCNATINGNITSCSIPLDIGKGSQGGAIYVNSGTCTYAGSTSGNTALKGGAIYVGTATLNVNGGSFKNNTAEEFGGAICSYFEKATINVTKANFSGNTATKTGGGAMAIGSGNVTINSKNDGDVTFKDNEANMGGAMWVSQSGNVKVYGITTFSANNALGDGGGAIWSGNGGILTIGESKKSYAFGPQFNNNIASGGKGRGGAIKANAGESGGGGTLTINAASFIGNKAGYDGVKKTINATGGAIFVAASTTKNKSIVTNIGTTAEESVYFEGNDGTQGGAINFASEDGVALTSSTNGSATKIRNVRFFKNGNSSKKGGAVLSSGIIDYENCAFITNKTSLYGGAVYVRENTKSKNSFTNCDFEYNNAANAGALNVELDTTVTCNGNKFVNNSATSNAGAVRTNGTLTMTNDRISNNTATQGGGIYVHTSGSATLNTVTIYQNTSSQNGGGIVNGHDLRTNGCNISSNNAGTNGGGVYVKSNGSTILDKSTEVSSNEAKTNGGGIAIEKISDTEDSNGAAAYGGTKIVGNTAGNKAGGIYFSSGESTFAYTFVTGNEAPKSAAFSIDTFADSNVKLTIRPSSSSHPTIIQDNITKNKNDNTISITKRSILNIAPTNGGYLSIVNNTAPDNTNNVIYNSSGSLMVSGKMTMDKNTGIGIRNTGDTGNFNVNGTDEVLIRTNSNAIVNDAYLTVMNENCIIEPIGNIDTAVINKAVENSCTFDGVITKNRDTDDKFNTGILNSAYNLSFGGVIHEVDTAISHQSGMLNVNEESNIFDVNTGIKMIKDDVVIPNVPFKLTYDGAITNASAYGIYETGGNTISNKGYINMNNNDKSVAVFLKDAGFELNYGLIRHATYGVEIENNATFKMSDGELRFNQKAVKIANGGSFEHKGGLIGSNAEYGVYNEGTYTVTGGDYSLNKMAVYNNGEMYVGANAKIIAYDGEDDTIKDIVNAVYEETYHPIHVIGKLSSNTKPLFSIIVSDATTNDEAKETDSDYKEKKQLGRVIADTTEDSSLKGKDIKNLFELVGDYKDSRTLILREGANLNNKGESIVKSQYHTDINKENTVIISREYTITYDKNLNEDVSNMPGFKTSDGQYVDTKYWNEDYTIPDNEPKVKNFKFDVKKSWNTSNDGTGDIYLRNTDYTDNKKLKVYAIWYNGVNIEIYHMIQDENGVYHDNVSETAGKYGEKEIGYAVLGQKIDDDFVSSYIKKDGLYNRSGIVSFSYYKVTGLVDGGVGEGNTKVYLYYNRAKYNVHFIGHSGVDKLVSEGLVNVITSRKNSDDVEITATYYARDNDTTSNTVSTFTPTAVSGSKISRIKISQKNRFTKEINGSTLRFSVVGKYTDIVVPNGDIKIEVFAITPGKVSVNHYVMNKQGKYEDAPTKTTQINIEDTSTTTSINKNINDSFVYEGITKSDTSKNSVTDELGNIITTDNEKNVVVGNNYSVNVYYKRNMYSLTVRAGKNALGVLIKDDTHTISYGKTVKHEVCAYVDKDFATQSGLEEETPITLYGEGEKSRNVDFVWVHTDTGRTFTRDDVATVKIDNKNYDLTYMSEIKYANIIVNHYVMNTKGKYEDTPTLTQNVKNVEIEDGKFVIKDYVANNLCEGDKIYYSHTNINGDKYTEESYTPTNEDTVTIDYYYERGIVTLRLYANDLIKNAAIKVGDNIVIKRNDVEYNIEDKNIVVSKPGLQYEGVIGYYGATVDLSAVIKGQIKGYTISFGGFYLGTLDDYNNNTSGRLLLGSDNNKYTLTLTEKTMDITIAGIKKEWSYTIKYHKNMQNDDTVTPSTVGKKYLPPDTAIEGNTESTMFGYFNEDAKISENGFNTEAYKFINWIDKNGKEYGENEKVSFLDMVSEDGQTIHLYAQWKKKNNVFPHIHTQPLCFEVGSTITYDDIMKKIIVSDGSGGIVSHEDSELSVVRVSIKKNELNAPVYPSNDAYAYNYEGLNKSRFTETFKTDIEKTYLVTVRAHNFKDDGSIGYYATREFEVNIYKTELLKGYVRAISLDSLDSIPDYSSWRTGEKYAMLVRSLMKGRSDNDTERLKDAKYVFSFSDNDIVKIKNHSKAMGYRYVPGYLYQNFTVKIDGSNYTD